jgi:hypothetical protein
MNDEYFGKVAKEWRQAVIDASGSGQLEVERLLFRFAKEVSRDTRHRAFDLAQQHAQAVFNMHHESGAGSHE